VHFHFCQQDADTLLEPSQSGTTCDQVSIKKITKKVPRALHQIENLNVCSYKTQNIKGVYKRYLLKQMEAIETDIQYKKTQDEKTGAGNPTA